jgi:hypothetical protein
MAEPDWNFEGERPFPDMSETGVNLCAYFDAMPQAKMRTYRADFSDQELMAWDGNFTTDNELLLPCCESEVVDPAMYRRYIEACIGYREKAGAAV